VTHRFRPSSMPTFRQTEVSVVPLTFLIVVRIRCTSSHGSRRGARWSAKRRRGALESMTWGSSWRFSRIETASPARPTAAVDGEVTVRARHERRRGDRCEGSESKTYVTVKVPRDRAEPAPLT
jgi:hypothetical protein